MLLASRAAHIIRISRHYDIASLEKARAAQHAPARGGACRHVVCGEHYAETPLDYCCLDAEHCWRCFAVVLVRRCRDSRMQGAGLARMQEMALEPLMFLYQVAAFGHDLNLTNRWCHSAGNRGLGRKRVGWRSRMSPERPLSRFSAPQPPTQPANTI